VHDRVVGRDRSGGHRFPAAFREAFLTDCFGVYESVAVDPEGPAPNVRRSEHRTKPTLIAGLVRVTELDGSVRYFMRPRRPRININAGGGVVRVDGHESSLRVGDDPKWLEPIEPALKDFRPRGFLVEGVEGIVSLELPERPFWLMAPDVNASSDEILISDRRPDPDEYFVMLVAEESEAARSVHTSLARCKELGLLDWSSRMNIAEGWLEYRRCRVLLSPWQTVAPVGVDPDLFARLAPQASDRIRLEGGLRDPCRRGAFMESALPSVSVVTEAEPVLLRVCEFGAADQALHELAVKRGVPGELPGDIPAGQYMLSAYAVDGCEEREIDSRRLLVTSWTELLFSREQGGDYAFADDDWSLVKLSSLGALL